MYAAHVERQARIRRAAVLGLICGADDTSDKDDSDFSDFGSMLLAAVFFKAASKRNHAKRSRSAATAFPSRHWASPAPEANGAHEC